MNKELEARLRSKVRKLIESVLNEEPPMVPDKNYKGGNKVVYKTIKIGDYKLNFGPSSAVITSKDGTSITIQEKDAIKIAQVIYRVLGKV